MKRRLLRAASLVAVWLAVIIGVLYALQRRYFHRLDTTPVASVSFAELSRAVGVDADRLRSLSHFSRGRVGPVTARPGSIRIVTLGDSFTFGAEVDDGLEYPALLCRRLHEAGFDNVEVLNFGFPGLGFAETLRIWERLASSYRPDFVLLGPQGMFLERDESFHWNGAYASSIHARYVLDGDGLRFIDVVGDSPRRRFEELHRFWPRLDYLRYDRSPPDFLQALLPDGKTIANPFYYTRLTPSEEQRELYLRMLSRLADQAPQVVLLHFNAGITAIGERLAERIVAAQLEEPLSGLYQRPRQHRSAAGNDMVANAFFQVLTRRQPRTVEELRLALPSAYAGPAPRPLPPFTTAELWLDQHRAARLIADEDDQPFMSTGAAALLALLPNGAGLDSALLVRLSFVPPPGATAELVLHDKHYSLPIARIAAEIPILVAELSRDVRTEGLLLSIGSGSLTIGGQRAAEVAADGRVSAAGFFRPAAGDFLDVERLPREGEVRLELDGLGVPVGRFKRVAGEARFGERGLHRWLRAAGDHHAEVVTR